MNEYASLSMQWVNLCLLIFAMIVGGAISYVIVNELRSTKKSNESMTKVLLQVVEVLDIIRQTLPIIKGWAELGRIGGVHSREAAKDIANQTAPLSDITKKLEEIPKVVAQSVDAAIKASAGSKDWHPEDDKPKVV